MKENRDDGFHLDLDDFLMGLLQLASELVFYKFRYVLNVGSQNVNKMLYAFRLKEKWSDRSKHLNLLGKKTHKGYFIRYNLFT